VHRIERGKAGIFGVDEDEPVLAIDGELVGIDVAGGVGHARDVEPLVVQRLLVGELTGTEHVLEPPDLRDGGDMDRLRRGGEPHRAHEVALEHREPAVEQWPN
jgi:hypothetical protein